MPERYDVAAYRHHRVAEKLKAVGEHDDAGYHFGVCGENAVKQALRASGVEAEWIRLGALEGKTARCALRGTPMKGHFPTLNTLVTQARTAIAANAQGRLAAPISALILDPSFAGRFAGWHIDIRYADSDFTPVSPADCARWQSDADDLVLGLLI